MKRMLSFLLACLLVLGLFPTHAHAQETESVVMETTMTETQATEEPTIPIETTVTVETEAPIEETTPVIEDSSEETVPVLYKDDGNYSRATAKTITSVATGSVCKLHVGMSGGGYGYIDDEIDYYKFTLSKSDTVTISVTSDKALKIGLENSSGSGLGTSYTRIEKTLSSGTYYIWVNDTEHTTANNYMLTISFAGSSGGGSGDDDSGSGGGSSHTHSYTTKVTKPTCTQRGYTTYTCYCGYSYKKNYTDAKGHTPGSWTVTEDATCTVTGTKTTKCTVCSVTYTASIPLKPHSYGNWVVTTEPTCTKTGVKTQTCSVCGDQKTESVPVIDHSYKWQITQEATCEKDGKKVGTCTGCGKQVSETIPMSGHSFQGGLYLRKAPTATAEGQWDGWCFNCQQYIDGTYPKLDASQTEYIIEDGIIEISHSAFKDNTQLTKIIIPDSVEEIGQSAFSGCTGLTSITIPDSVTRIYTRAFENCTALTSVKFPDTVNEIYTNRLFYYCTSLQNVTLPKGCKEIGEYAFSHCESLTSITIPEGVTAIGAYAFSSCENLSSITLPDSVTYSESDAFLYCYKLKEVHISSLESWCNVRYSFRSFNLYLNGELVTNCIIPEGVTSISGGAFCNCASLKTVTVPASVTSFGGYVFEMDGWTKIDAVYFLGDAPEFQYNAFASNVKKAYYPAGNETWTESARKQADPRGYAEWNPCEHTIENGVCPAPDACKNCGAPVGYTHDYVDATCTAPITCPGCGATKGTALGHTEVLLEGKIATCTEPGLTEGKQCRVCKEILVKQKEVPALEHDYVNYTCTRCGVEKYQVTRISGSDRHDTAFQIANMLKAALKVEKFDTILIASGSDSADALAGSYLASVKGAPILLSRNNSHPRNLAYIQENLSENGIVYILGGTGAVPQEMEDLLIQNGIRYERVKGTDRFGTNLEILKKAGEIQGNEILVSTAYNFADSLSASATGKPILLVNSKRNTLNSAQKAYLAEITANGPKTFTIIGGTGAVSEELAMALSAYGTVNREKGTTRESTSVRVAEVYFQNPSMVFLAYSRNFPDGLCGGPLAYAMKAPLLLVNAKQEAYASAYVETNGITHAYILGGTGAVPDAVARKALNLPNDYVIPKFQ